MRITTWNVNGLRARLPFVLHWLAERRPDLVGLQELKLTEDQFPHGEIAAAGYRAAIHGQKSWNGVAVLSREPVEVTQVGLPGQEELGARLITVRQGGLSFTTIYVPNGKRIEHTDFPRKLAWLDALLHHLRRNHDPDVPEILCGDFNLCPASIDSWNEAGLRGTIFHTGDERSRFRAFLEWGLVDLFREAHPGLPGFSWWDYRGGAFHKNEGLRIDFLLATRSIAARAVSTGVDRDYRKKKDGLTASDHAPVTIQIG